MKNLILLLILVTIAIPASGAILITEVYYDHAGADTDYEWVELLNTSSSPMDLTGYQLACGGTDYSFNVTILDFEIPGCSTAVVGAPIPVPGNGNPVFSQAVVLNIQNSGTMSDGVALFAPGSDPAFDCPLDAVIYGGANTNNLLDESCTIGAVDAPDVSAGNSIERVADAGIWATQSVPNPNHVNFSFDCDGVVPVSERTWDGVRALYR